MGDRVDFAVETKTLHDCAIVRVDGELDMAGAASLEEALSAAEHPYVVLDLSGCTFLDSAGVSRERPTAWLSWRPIPASCACSRSPP